MRQWGHMRQWGQVLYTRFLRYTRPLRVERPRGCLTHNIEKLAHHQVCELMPWARRPADNPVPFAG
jgi:hypothetical protein